MKHKFKFPKIEMPKIPKLNLSNVNFAIPEIEKLETFKAEINSEIFEGMTTMEDVLNQLKESEKINSEFQKNQKKFQENQAKTNKNFQVWRIALASISILIAVFAVYLQVQNTFQKEQIQVLLNQEKISNEALILSSSAIDKMQEEIKTLQLKIENLQIVNKETPVSSKKNLKIKKKKTTANKVSNGINAVPSLLPVHWRSLI